MLKGKKILLIIGGGIAAFKCHDLIRKLRDKGAHVTPVLTEAGKEFVTPLSISVLSSSKVYTELFDFDDEIQMGHIELSRASDVVLVVPATANLLAKMAGGMADDLATTLLLATDKKVFVAPAMNVKMWEHSATKRNIGILEQDDIQFIGPSEGEMACGEYGFGRMAEPEQILSELAQQFNSQKLSGCHFIVTAGPTYESIDPVRFIGNHSSGKMGFAIAEAAANLGAEVYLISGPSYQQIKHSLVHRIDVVSADEMYKVAHEYFKEVDIAILSAAVSDYKPKNVATQKIKKKGSALDIELTQTKDILASLGKIKEHQFLVGFALETENEIENAKTKLIKKKLDLIVLNSLNDKGAGFQHDTNKVTLISKDNKVTPYGVKPKSEVAHDILNYIIREIHV